MKDYFVDLENFNRGFYALQDTTKAPFGALRVMRNAQVTDRGGLSPRPGTVLLGAENTNGAPVRGFYAYKKSFGTNEILVKAYDDELEGYSKNHTTAGWFRIKSGFSVHSAATPKEFGFVTSLVNTDN
jgi:hypothetical protein